MASGEKQARNQEIDANLIKVLLHAMALCGDGRRRDAIERAIRKHLELHLYYNEREAAEAFGMSLRRFFKREELLGLKPCLYEEGVGLYRWDRVIPRVKRYWSKRVKKKGW
jgi:hypothetical protein